MTGVSPVICLGVHGLLEHNILRDGFQVAGGRDGFFHAGFGLFLLGKWRGRLDKKYGWFYRRFWTCFLRGFKLQLDQIRCVVLDISFRD